MCKSGIKAHLKLKSLWHYEAIKLVLYVKGKPLSEMKLWNFYFSKKYIFEINNQRPLNVQFSLVFCSRKFQL